MPQQTTCEIFVPDKRSSPEPLGVSTDSKTLDYQRTNPREYQIVRTHTREITGLQDLLEITPKKEVIFIIGDWNAKVGSQETPGVIGKFGLGAE